MDRIALISDIHGNLPALEAVLADIRNRGIQRIICLGDLAGKGPSAEAAVDRVKENCELVLKGNWDHFIAEAQDQEPFSWHQSKLRKAQVEYLRALPLYGEFHMSGKLIRVCHAAPFDLFHRVFSSAATEDKLKLFEGLPENSEECDVVGYGDLHGAFIQNFRGKTLVNVGSVGNPLEITQASYGILEGEYDATKPSSFSAALIRVPYDIEEAIRQARESEMPDIELYVNELRTAKYRGRQW